MFTFTWIIERITRNINADCAYPKSEIRSTNSTSFSNFTLSISHKITGTTIPNPKSFYQKIKFECLQGNDFINFHLTIKSTCETKWKSYMNSSQSSPLHCRIKIIYVKMCECCKKYFCFCYLQTMVDTVIMNYCYQCSDC